LVPSPRSASASAARKAGCELGSYDELIAAYEERRDLVRGGISRDSPPMLALIALLGRDRTAMGPRRSGALSNGLLWITTAVMTVAALALLLTFAVPGL